MSEFRTDEESIELIRNWWKENGTFLIVGIVVVLAAVFGWQAWQKHRAEQRGLAASRFEQFREALKPGSTTAPQTQALLLLQLKDEHDDTGYGQLAALLDARRLADRAEFDAAGKELQWVIDTAQRPELADIARLRLARVTWAKGDVDAALQQLDGVGSEGYSVVLDELRGDLLLAKGDRAGAYAAYQRAVGASEGNPQPVLEIKRNDVAPANAVAASNASTTVAPR